VTYTPEKQVMEKHVLRTPVTAGNGCSRTEPVKNVVNTLKSQQMEKVARLEFVMKIKSCWSMVLVKIVHNIKDRRVMENDARKIHVINDKSFYQMAHARTAPLLQK